MLDPAVERDLPVELVDDVLEDAEVLLERVGVERRHHAARAEPRHRDGGAPAADRQHAAGPEPLAEAVDAADDDVRPEPAAVEPDVLDRAVGRDEQRQDVEPPGAIVQDQPCPATDDVLDVGGDTRILPGAVVHERFSLGVENGAVPKQLRMGSRGDHASTGVLDMDDAVAVETQRCDVHLPQPFAGHRLHRVPPELRDVHDPSKRAAPPDDSARPPPRSSRPRRRAGKASPAATHRPCSNRDRSSSPDATGSTR